MGPHPHHHHSSPFHSIMTRRTALSVALGSVGSILLVACGTRGHEGSSASSTGSSPASSPSVSPPCLLFICRRLRYPDRERYAVGFAERGDAERLSVRIADCLCFSGDCSSERGVIARVFALPGE